MSGPLKVQAGPQPKDTYALESRQAISYKDAIDTLRHDYKMKTSIAGIPFPVFFFCIFVAMLYQHIPSDTLYDQGSSVSAVLDSKGTDAITTDTTMKFENIGTVSDVFDWLSYTFVPNVFVTTDYNGHRLTADKYGRIAMFNKVLGAVVLEVTRKQIHPCQAMPFLTALYPSCYDPTNTTTEQILISFDTNATEAANVISRLKARGDWLDFATLQLGITVVTYNGEIQGYTVSELNIDFSQGGTLSMSSSSTPTISDPYKDTAPQVLDILVGICLLLSIIDRIKRFGTFVWKKGLRTTVFHRCALFTFINEMYVVILVVVFYILWAKIVLVMFDGKFRGNLAHLVTSGKKFDAKSDELLGLVAVIKSLQSVAELTVGLRLVATFTVFALGIRILSQFQFHPRLSILTRTVANALQSFGAFFIVFIVIFITFSVSGMVLFGDRVVGFSTLPLTMETCINMLFGNFEYTTISDLQAPLGKTYYWVYMIVVSLVLLNMMLAIVLDSYAAVTEEGTKMKRNISLVRSIDNLLYDTRLYLCGGIVLSSDRAIACARGKAWTRKHVIYQGRVIPDVLLRVLENRASVVGGIQTGETEQSNLIMSAVLIALFPGANMTETEAKATIEYLLQGASNPKANKRAIVDKDDDDMDDGISQENPVAGTVTGSRALTKGLDRMEALERKVDLLVAILTKVNTNYTSHGLNTAIQPIDVDVPLQTLE